MNSIQYFLGGILIFFIWSCSSTEQEQVLIDGSNGVRPLVEALAADFLKDNPDFRLTIAAGMGSKERIVALERDSIDIAMASHGIDEKALSQRSLDVILFAQMPVVMAVHKDAQVGNLTSEQICSIYAGEITNWSELGGADLSIVPLSRPFEEVDAEVVLEHIPCFSKIELDSSVQFEERSGQMARALEATSGSIGMTTMTRVNQSEGTFRAIAIDAVSPAIENINAGRYQMLRNSYLVVKKERASAIDAFLSYVKSDLGKQVLLDNDAIPR